MRSEVGEDLSKDWRYLLWWKTIQKKRSDEL